MNPQAALAQPQAAMPQAVTNRLAGALKASLSPNTSRAYRTAWAALDLALASVMADAGLRRSEAAASVWGDLRPAPDGDGGLLAIHRSKTDQDGEGALTFVTQAACDDAGRLRRLSGWPTDDAPMFAVRGQQPPPPKPSATESPPRPRRRGLARATPGTRAASAWPCA